jgi:uncharacterized protein (DUF433 family)
LPEDYLIVSDPDICGGKPVVKGTRVPVQYILQLSGEGYDIDKIHEEYPTVPKGLIAEVIRYLRESRIIKVAH